MAQFGIIQILVLIQIGIGLLRIFHVSFSLLSLSFSFLFLNFLFFFVFRFQFSYTDNYTSVACSKNGKFVWATSYSGQVAYSTDFGSAFADIENVPNQQWTAIAVAQDTSNNAFGTYLVLTTYNGTIWLNFDNGFGPWVDTSTNTSYIVPPNTVTEEITSYATPLRYTSVAVSETGQYTAAVADAGGNWFSPNYAHDWLVGYPGFYDWTKIVSTGDGVCLAATVGGSDGGVWIGFIPHLNPTYSPSVEPTTMSPTIQPTAPPSMTPTTPIPTENPTAIPTEVHYANWGLTPAPQYNYSAVAISGSCTVDDDNPVLALFATQYNGGNSSAIISFNHL